MDIVFPFDFEILDFIQKMRTPVGDVIIPLITHLGDGGVFWIILAFVLILIPKTRKFGLAMAIALAIEATLCNVIVKPLVNRTRPFVLSKETIELLIKAPTDPSFPSGHTGASFACAAALFFSKNKFWIPATILAALIGFSRLYLYVHFPSDVFIGALLGIGTGFLGALIAKNIYEAREEAKKAKKLQ